MRKGYNAEYLCKRKLIKAFGKENVIKIAIGGSADFLVLKPSSNEILKIIEVKETKKKKWYPNEHDRNQFKVIKKISEEHKIPAEYWIRIRDRWRVLSLKDVEKIIDNL